ncbi:cysteine desulfurase-like protein [Saccharothrix mutabilis subsp. mutabilis]|uniref:Cysteine desulfurase-like protein n=2 Tax=Saccharothrix mutabilis TaxID=33921 RepID=A0ABP3CM39_9PSEU
MARMSYDVEAVRARFPSLTTGTAHFDGPGGSQVPARVADAVHRAMTASLANRGRVTAAERATDDIVLAARHALADLLDATPGGIVLGRSATQLTYDFARTLAKSWEPGDEVVVTRLDHDANVRPWVQVAEAVGAVVRWVDFDPATGELDPVAPTDRTRLVAVTAASNLIGTRPPLADIARATHEAGALLYVDGVHFAAHHAVDVAELGADFFVCSPYKFFGPHLGVLAADPALLEALRPDKLLPSTDAVPERFELGTLPYELLAGTTAAVDFIADLVPGDGDRRARVKRSMDAVAEHEGRLRAVLEEGLRDLPGVTVHSRAALRTPTLLLTFADHDPADAYRFLATRNINAPAGSFYAIETSRHLGLGDRGGLRVGLAAYSTDDEVARLLTALSDFLDG